MINHMMYHMTYGPVIYNLQPRLYIVPRRVLQTLKIDSQMAPLIYRVVDQAQGCITSVTYSFTSGPVDLQSMCKVVDQAQGCITSILY